MVKKETQITNQEIPRVELLAPVGKWDVLETVITAGADAVYLGGKKYNMRLHRKDFNFTEEELQNVVNYAHIRDVKVYVTVNNMLTNTEMAELARYLIFLQKIDVDGLIVQDLGVIQLTRKLGLSIPLHASVMMNAHNRESLVFLKELGITRVILGRELTLTEIKLLHSQVPLELEYFAHGDMCFSQSGQCYHSGMVFGKSSNRGRCFKPCRWPFELVDRDTGEVLPVRAPGPYFLAVKDMCLLPYLPEVIDAGICSLKIEGRMRSADYLGPLISLYRCALNQYYADPSGYSLDWEKSQKLSAMRIRDLSPMYAFGNPGPASIGYTGEREYRFFSQAVKEPIIEEKDFFLNPLPQLQQKTGKCHPKPLLSVKAGSLAAALAAIENGADVVYTSGESFLSQGRPWHLKDYQELVALGRQGGVQVIIGTPPITMPREIKRITHLLETLQEIKPDGVLVANLGTIYAASKITDLPLYADYSCNIANKDAAVLLQNYRVKQVTAPLEFCYEEILDLLQDSSLPLETVVHGSLPAMVSDHCLPAALREGVTKHQMCPGPCQGTRYGLQDTEGQIHPVEIDYTCRNHLFLAHELALLPYLSSFSRAGFKSLRLEIPTYTAEEAGLVVKLYRENLDQIISSPENYCFPAGDWNKLQEIRKGPFGTGPFTQGVKVRETANTFQA